MEGRGGFHGFLLLAVVARDAKGGSVPFGFDFFIGNTVSCMIVEFTPSLATGPSRFCDFRDHFVTPAKGEGLRKIIEKKISHSSFPFKKDFDLLESFAWIEKENHFLRELCRSFNKETLIARTGERGSKPTEEDRGP